VAGLTPHELPLSKQEAVEAEAVEAGPVAEVAVALVVADVVAGAVVEVVEAVEEKATAPS